MTSPIARHGRLPTRSPIAAVLRYFGMVLAVLSVSALAVTLVAAWDIASSIKPGVDLPGQENIPPSIGAIEGEVNLLLVGSDSGEGDAAFGERGESLNDVTMLLHISADHRNATLLSFPRDLYVSIPECPDPDGGTFNPRRAAKINTSLSFGGLACTVLTVENLTGLSIPFAALIEFNGVIEMSNAVGGVMVCVADRIEDRHTGVFLEPGEHTLKGWDALQFLRTRYGLSSGSDTARISNQQVFLSSLLRTVKSTETLTNPVTMYGLAKAAASNMVMSTSLRSPDTMVAIALALKDIDLGKVVFAQYPSYEAGGGLFPLAADGATLVDAIASDRPLIVTGSTGQGAEIGPDAPHPGASAPAPSETPTGTPEDPGVELPESVTGQTADQQTCSRGRPLSDQ